MLEANGMRMSKEHTLEFFEILDADKSGGLSMQEFKDFLFNDECRNSKDLIFSFHSLITFFELDHQKINDLIEFRDLMRRVRID
jgi:hypothetical protein